MLRTFLKTQRVFGVAAAAMALTGCDNRSVADAFVVIGITDPEPIEFVGVWDPASGITPEELSEQAAALFDGAGAPGSSAEFREIGSRADGLKILASAVPPTRWPLGRSERAALRNELRDAFASRVTERAAVCGACFASQRPIMESISAICSEHHSSLRVIVMLTSGRERSSGSGLDFSNEVPDIGTIVAEMDRRGLLLPGACSNTEFHFGFFRLRKLPDFVENTVSLHAARESVWSDVLRRVGASTVRFVPGAVVFPACNGEEIQ